MDLRLTRHRGFIRARITACSWEFPPCSLGLQPLDDDLPAPARLAAKWSQISGPGTVVFANPNVPATTATFPVLGIYVLRLSANDGELSASKDMQITVIDPSIDSSLTVHGIDDQGKNPRPTITPTSTVNFRCRHTQMPASTSALEPPRSFGTLGISTSVRRVVYASTLGLTMSKRHLHSRSGGSPCSMSSANYKPRSR